MRRSWDETWMSVAVTIGRRSLCSRDQVGAVIVSATNRLIDTGYNGPPTGFTRGPQLTITGNRDCSAWCERAIRSSSMSTRQRATLERDYSDCPTLHAEANALMFSDRRLREGGTIYVSSGTCSGCAKLVANSGLQRAVYRDTAWADHRDSERWYGFLRDCGVLVDIYPESEAARVPRAGA